jgi:hypothetical protein
MRWVEEMEMEEKSGSNLAVHNAESNRLQTYLPDTGRLALLHNKKLCVSSRRKSTFH